METKMPAFPIKSTDELASFLNPVTPEIATQIVAQANKADDGIACAAVYYWTSPAKTKRESMLVVLILEMEDGRFAFVRTGDYRPRKDGKADLIFKTDYIAKSWEV